MGKGRYQHVPNVSKHSDHDPNDPRVFVIEDLAMLNCDYCGDGNHRWRDRSDDIWCHADDCGYEGVECEASSILSAAVELGIPVYTGAELQFHEDD